jgi:amino acid transporter
MRRVFDFLGLTRPAGAPRPKLRDAVLSGVVMFLVVLGVAVIAGNAADGDAALIWFGIALIVLGVGCWVVGGLVFARASAAHPSRRPDDDQPL